METARLARVGALVVGVDRFVNLSELGRWALLEVIERMHVDMPEAGDPELALEVSAFVQGTAGPLLELMNAIELAQGGGQVGRPAAPGFESMYARALDRACRALDTHGVLKLDVDHPNQHVRHLARILSGRRGVVVG